MNCFRKPYFQVRQRLSVINACYNFSLLNCYLSQLIQKKFLSPQTTFDEHKCFAIVSLYFIENCAAYLSKLPSCTKIFSRCDFTLFSGTSKRGNDLFFLESYKDMQSCLLLLTICLTRMSHEKSTSNK